MGEENSHQYTIRKDQTKRENSAVQWKKILKDFREALAFYEDYINYNDQITIDILGPSEYCKEFMVVSFSLRTRKVYTGNWINPY